MAIVEFNSLTRERQRFFLNGVEVPGIQSLELTNEPNIANYSFLGQNPEAGSSHFVYGGDNLGKVSFNSLLVSKDYFVPWTGTSGAHGFILADTVYPKYDSFTNYKKPFPDSPGFISGYLTSYNLSCGMNEIPQINSNFSVFGDIGTLSSTEHPLIVDYWDKLYGPFEKPISRIGNSQSTTLTISDLDLTRIISYNFNISLDRTPTYTFGKRLPIEINTFEPITVSISFQAEIDSFTLSRLNAYPETNSFNDITISINDKDDGTNIMTYVFENCKMISENYISNTNNNVMIERTYKGVYFCD